MKEKKEIITMEAAIEMAASMLYEYLTARHGQRLVADWEDPTAPYIQEQNSWSMAGEVFSVPCPGLGPLDMTDYREGWDCEHLNDDEVLRVYVDEGDTYLEIEQLAEQIYASANENH
jgi:hypothetical protein